MKRMTYTEYRILQEKYLSKVMKNSDANGLTTLIQEFMQVTEITMYDIFYSEIDECFIWQIQPDVNYTSMSAKRVLTGEHAALTVAKFLSVLITPYQFFPVTARKSGSALGLPVLVRDNPDDPWRLDVLLKKNSVISGEPPKCECLTGLYQDCFPFIRNEHILNTTKQPKIRRLKW